LDGHDQAEGLRPSRLHVQWCSTGDSQARLQRESNHSERLSDSDAKPYSIAHGNTHSNACPITHGYTLAYGHTKTISDTDTRSFAHGNAYAYAYASS
jgi:hypothetical protein